MRTRTPGIEVGPRLASTGGKRQNEKRVRQVRLKVFRSVAGFNDAYVAAPSRKAALEAWGSSKDLFATGAAEMVDPERAPREVFDQPGQVVLLSRGSLVEQLSAGAAGSRRQAAKQGRAEDNSLAVSGRAARAQTVIASKPKASPKRRPAPKRDALDAAERELASAVASNERELAMLDKQMQSLEIRRSRLLAKNRDQISSLKARLARETEKHRAALEKWAATGAP